MEIKNKKIAVTGGYGFLGSHLVKEINSAGGIPIRFRSTNYDLRNLDDTKKFFDETRPDALIHAASLYGGFAIHEKIPATIYDANMRMMLNVFNCAIDSEGIPRLEKIVALGSGCAYPGSLGEDMVEESLWDGPVDKSIRNYGVVKRLMETTGHVYRDQFELNSISVNPATIYGEGDTFNPERSHVPAALIRTFTEAKENNLDKVELWGVPETVREFIYVKDAAIGIVKALESFDGNTQSDDQSKYSLNIGTGVGTSIGDFANLISDIVGFKGEIGYNGRSAGQQKKSFIVSRMKRELGWEPKTSLKDGLKKTVDWYLSNRDFANKRE